jgi:hypothetical protein
MALSEEICPREKLCSHWATALAISISGLAAAETIGFLATVYLTNSELQRPSSAVIARKCDGRRARKSDSYASFPK